MKKCCFHTFVFIIAIFFVSSPAYAQTISTTSPTQDTQTIIKLLQEQIKTLETQIVQLKVQLESTNQQITAIQIELKINRSLQRGITGDDVKSLQTFLSQFPDIYPEKLVTGYFGPLTESAVKKWQAQQGIESVGIVGPKTIARLNEILEYGAGQSGVVPPGLFTAPGVQNTIQIPTTVSPVETVTPTPAQSGTVGSVLTPTTVTVPTATTATTVTTNTTTAIISTTPTATTTATTTTASCTESWICYNWSLCSNDTQTRTCIDNNNCSTTNARPALSQSCRDKTDVTLTVVASSSNTTAADSGNNSVVTVQKVGTGPYDFIKYSFNLSDPDGIAEFEIKPANNSFVQARNYRDGSQPYPSCPVGPVVMGQFTLSLSLDQASWPFHGWVLDCVHNTKYPIEIPAPSPTSLLDLRAKNLAAVSQAIASISVILEKLLNLLKSY